MKKFSDFGIDTLKEKKIFPGKTISIEDLIDKDIVVNDYIEDVKTSFGEGRYLLSIEFESAKHKFFTDSKNIKEALDRIPKDGFPFAATIKQQKLGGGKKTYYFI